MDKTARDLILELYKDDHITKGETDLLLDAINKPPQPFTVPYNTGTITQKPDWTYDPYKPGQPWYTTTGTDNTQLTTKDTTNG